MHRACVAWLLAEDVTLTNEGADDLGADSRPGIRGKLKRCDLVGEDGLLGRRQGSFGRGPLEDCRTWERRDGIACNAMLLEATCT